MHFSKKTHLFIFSHHKIFKFSRVSNILGYFSMPTKNSSHFSFFQKLVKIAQKSLLFQKFHRGPKIIQNGPEHHNIFQKLKKIIGGACWWVWGSHRPSSALAARAGHRQHEPTYWSRPRLLRARQLPSCPCYLRSPFF